MSNHKGLTISLQMMTGVSSLFQRDMPFIALDKNTGERIVVTGLVSPREELRGKHLECQLCGGRMYLRGGKDVQFHFYHHRVCTSNYKTNPETPHHIAGKFYIAENILPQLNDYANFKPKYEVPIPEVMRVADVLLEFNMGWRIAHEIQLSSIGVEELNQRTNDYLQAGIDVLWWFGKSADNRTNRDWSIRKYGFSLSLSFSDDISVTCGYWYEEEKKDVYGNKIRTQQFRSNSELRAKEDPPVIGKVAYWWLDYSFVRYYQLWRKGNNELYIRAFGASKRTIASYNGKTGAGKGRWFNKENNDWVVDLPTFLEREEKYDKVRRLPDNVVDVIRTRAFEKRAKI